MCKCESEEISRWYDLFHTKTMFERLFTVIMSDTEVHDLDVRYLTLYVQIVK